MNHDIRLVPYSRDIECVIGGYVEQVVWRNTSAGAFVDASLYVLATAIGIIEVVIPIITMLGCYAIDSILCGFSVFQ